VLDLSTMEQTTRKRGERAPAEQVEETPETETDREAKLAELNELLDEIEDVLDENEESVTDSRKAIILADVVAHRSSDDARLARAGLYSPDDLEEEIAANLASYADELAKQDAEELQAELAKFVAEQNPPCSYCGMCPVRPGCPFQAGGEHWYRDFDGTFVHD